MTPGHPVRHPVSRGLLCPRKWPKKRSRRQPSPMIRIAVAPAAFDAIAATLPLGGVGYEPQRDAQGQRRIWRRLSSRSSPPLRPRRELQRCDLEANQIGSELGARVAANSSGLRGRCKQEARSRALGRRAPTRGPRKGRNRPYARVPDRSLYGSNAPERPFRKRAANASDRPEADGRGETSDNLIGVEWAGHVGIGFHLERSMADPKSLFQLSAEINQVGIARMAARHHQMRR